MRFYHLISIKNRTSGGRKFRPIFMQRLANRDPRLDQVAGLPPKANATFPFYYDTAPGSLEALEHTVFEDVNCCSGRPECVIHKEKYHFAIMFGLVDPLGTHFEHP